MSNYTYVLRIKGRVVGEYSVKDISPRELETLKAQKAEAYGCKKEDVEVTLGGV